MIDIIIPCHNSHKTIDRCLGSLLAQSIRDFEVTLVNDGGEGYSEVIKRYPDLTIKEIGYEQSKGPGGARNYGLENTHNEYIMFLDSDDAICNPFTMWNINNIFNNHKQICMIICNIVAENPNGSVRYIKGNRNFLHGKAYRRKFLEDHDIKFNLSSCCEDSSFNFLCFDIMNDRTEQHAAIDYDAYGWMYNKESLGRKNVVEWEHCTVPEGVVDNYIYTFDELKKRNLFNNKILKEMVSGMVHTIFMVLGNYTNYPQYKEQNREQLEKYYNLVFKDIEDKVTDEMLKEVAGKFPIAVAIEDAVPKIRKVFERLRNGEDIV